MIVRKIQLRRGVESTIPVLSEGEPGYTTDTKRFIIGDGTSYTEYAKLLEVASGIELVVVGDTFTVNLLNNDSVVIGSFVIPVADTNNTGLLSATLFNDLELLSRKGQAGGYAPLDESGKIPLSYFYDSMKEQLEYCGTFDGSTLPTMVGTRSVRKGDIFIASGSGIINGIDFKPKDWLVFKSPTEWDKIDNTDSVASVNGQTGVIVLSASSIKTADDITVETALANIGQDVTDILDSVNELLEELLDEEEEDE